MQMTSISPVSALFIYNWKVIGTLTRPNGMI
jgi:hypothetical protein